MDPLTAANTLATIVSLLAIFKQERVGRADLDHRVFIEWLEHHRHEEIKELLIKNDILQREVDEILRAEHAEIMAAIHHMNSVLADLISRIDAFVPLARTICPTLGLSDQAISILRQLRASGAPEVGYQTFLGGRLRVVPFGFGNTGAEFHLDDPLFAKDDLDSLARAGLLRLRISPKGDQFYGITRLAVSFLEAFDASSPAT